VKDSLSQLSVKKKEIDDKYDQSIAAIRDWEADQNKKLDAVEEQLKLRYDGTVIDVALQEQQAEMERNRQDLLDSIKQDQEVVQNFSMKIEKYKQMRGETVCSMEENKDRTEENKNRAEERLK